MMTCNTLRFSTAHRLVSKPETLGLRGDPKPQTPNPKQLTVNSMDVLMDCVGFDEQGHAGSAYTRFSDLQVPPKP